MMRTKQLTLSIVIPAYNEERYLKACLAAIARQTELPDEVIVVDNNSTDKTAEIAKTYKFVRILYEHRQHQVFAQQTGFNQVKSDIIGRIDADSLLPIDWVKNVKEAFNLTPSLVALTGSAIPYDVKLKSFGRNVFRFYNWLASQLAGTRMLWGANCALRKDAWQKVASRISERADMWEDQDLSFCLKSVGVIGLLNSIDIGTSFRSIHHPFLHQIRYQFRSVRTFYLHTNLLTTFVYAVLWFTMTPLYFVVLFDTHILKPLTNFKEPF